MPDQTIHEQVVSLLSSEKESLSAQLLAELQNLLPLITTEELLTKYYKGRVEHADDLSKLPALEELRAEIVDAIIYLAIYVSQVQE